MPSQNFKNYYLVKLFFINRPFITTLTDRICLCMYLFQDSPPHIILPTKPQALKLSLTLVSLKASHYFYTQMFMGKLSKTAYKIKNTTTISFKQFIFVILFNKTMLEATSTYICIRT